MTIDLKMVNDVLQLVGNICKLVYFIMLILYALCLHDVDKKLIFITLALLIIRWSAGMTKTIKTRIALFQRKTVIQAF